MGLQSLGQTVYDEDLAKADAAKGSWSQDDARVKKLGTSVDRLENALVHRTASRPALSIVALTLCTASQGS